MLNHKHSITHKSVNILLASDIKPRSNYENNTVVFGQARMNHHKFLFEQSAYVLWPNFVHLESEAPLEPAAIHDECLFVVPISRPQKPDQLFSILHKSLHFLVSPINLYSIFLLLIFFFQYHCFVQILKLPLHSCLKLI